MTLFGVAIGLMSRMFAHSAGYRVSISGRVIPKTQKMVLDATLLNIQRYKARIKGVKGSNTENGEAPSPTPQCGSY